jgi:TIR domain
VSINGELMSVRIKDGPKREAKVLLVVTSENRKFGENLHEALARQNDPNTLYCGDADDAAAAVVGADIVLLIARTDEKEPETPALRTVAQIAAEAGCLVWACVGTKEQQAELVAFADSILVRETEMGRKRHDVALLLHLELIRSDGRNQALERRAVIDAAMKWHAAGRPRDLLLESPPWRDFHHAIADSYVMASREEEVEPQPIRNSLVGSRPEREKAKPLHPLDVSQMAQARRRAPRPSAAGLVDCSIFAPSKAATDSKIFVQVMLHLVGDLQAARDRAEEIDEAAVLRGTSTLELPIPNGSRVTMSLTVEDSDHLTIERPVQTVMWSRQLVAVNFLVKPTVRGIIFPMVHIACNGAIACEMRFKLEVVAPWADVEESSIQPVEGRKYQRVFFSYSSQDRVRVLEVAQSYRALGVSFFQDILNLEPGQRWQQGLYKEIDACDLFLLFWSKASSQSEWVAKEAQYALERLHYTSDRPEIVPLILEGPPPPPVPTFLSHLHFDDWMRYAIESAKGTANERATLGH